jgi:hypothetical protein
VKKIAVKRKRKSQQVNVVLIGVERQNLQLQSAQRFDSPMKSERRIDPLLTTDRKNLLPQLNSLQRVRSEEGDLPFARAVSTN